LANSGDYKGKAPVQWKAKSIARGKHLTGQAEAQALPRREVAEKEFVWLPRKLSGDTKAYRPFGA